MVKALVNEPSTSFICHLGHDALMMTICAALVCYRTGTSGQEIPARMLLLQERKVGPLWKLQPLPESCWLFVFAGRLSSRLWTVPPPQVLGQKWRPRTLCMTWVHHVPKESNSVNCPWTPDLPPVPERYTHCCMVVKQLGTSVLPPCRPLSQAQFQRLPGVLWGHDL